MSREDAQRFMDEVKRDKALQAEVSQASQRLIHIAKAHGFEFTAKELREHMRDRWGMTKALALDDADFTCG